MLIDSHCHLTDARFRDDLAGVLTRAAAAGVGSMITIGSDLEDARVAVGLADAHASVWASVGIHPHVAAAAGEGMAEIEALAARPRVVAIGETGLDYHYDNSPRAVQRRLFEEHLELAARASLPVVVHTRDADEDAAAVIRSAPAGVTGVLHCFTAGDGLLDTALEHGWYISFAGVITFRTWDGLERLRRVPPERLLVETDSPYLAPVPHRGRRNEPAFVVEVCRAAAAALDEETAVIAARTAANARRLFRLDAPVVG